MPSIREEKDDADSTPFSLRNAGGGFEGRSSNIFGQLDVLERQHISHEQNRTDLEEFADLRGDQDDSYNFIEGNSSGQQGASGSTESSIPTDKPSDSNHSFRRERKHDRQSGGRQPPRQELQFRRPSGRPPGRHRGQRSRVPDLGDKPHTWTHYSLDDVKGSDMSDRANTQAALAFLDERRKLREEGEMGMEQEEAFDVGSAACSKGMFSFAKRSKTDKSSNVCDDDKLDKDQSLETDNVDQPDKHKSPASGVKLAASDTETLEEETAGSSSTTTKDDAVQTGFKSRKGIRRNIRARDDD